MTKKYRKDFLNYLEGTLSDEETTSFEKALGESPELQDELADYERIIHLEEKINTENFELDERFVSRVMARVKNEPGFFRSLLMEIRQPSRSLTAGVGGLAVLAICVTLAYQNYDRADLAELKKENSTSYEATEPPLEKDRDLAKGQASKAKDELRDKKDLGKQSSEISFDLRERVESEALPRKAGALDQAISKSLPSSGAAISQDSFYLAPGVLPEGEIFRDLTSLNNERYSEVGENAPILTSVEPMSTFSIDVDTGSYTNSRRFLQNGQLPPSEAVRIEEFINYFDYNYPSASKKPFAANFEIAPSIEKDGKYLLKVGIKARESGVNGEEKPWNLVFLIDVSGSMNEPNKLPLVQRSLEVLTNKMRPGDKVSLVTYAGVSGVVLPPTDISKKSEIIGAIQRLGAGGSTNGSAGVLQAYETAEQAFIKGGVNRVILATDGDFNVGLTSQDELIKLIEKKRKSGITLTTIGFGQGNYNETTMEQLANKGNGNYFYIDNFGEARKIFEEDLFGTIEVVAKDVKLQIEFNPEHVAQYRLIGYENRKLNNEDFKNDKVDAGEIGAGHTVTALYELALTGSEAAKALSSDYRYKKPELKVDVKAKSKELAFLKIRYKQPDGETSKLLSFPVLSTEIENSFAAATSDFRFAAAVSTFAEKLRDSKYSSELTYSEIATIAENAKGEDKRGYRRELVELVRNAASLSK